MPAQYRQISIDIQNTPPRIVSFVQYIMFIDINIHCIITIILRVKRIRVLISFQFQATTAKKSPNAKNNNELFHYGEYSTDTGLIVPALSLKLRNRLFAAAEARGITRERLVELVARSTSEITIQLLGGSHRLNPLNSHQVRT